MKNCFTKLAAVALPLLLASCANVSVPNGRSVQVPTASPPVDRYKGLNEERDPIVRVKLGKDVLMPQRPDHDPLPADHVGPFELRGESLASALQMVLDDYDISLAFESDSAMTSRISVANLRGSVQQVVDRMCELANLYCIYKDEVLTVKDTETFVVDMPPMGGTSGSSGNSSSSDSSSSDSDSSSSSNSGGSGNSSSSGSSGSSGESGEWAGYDQIVDGLEAIIGATPTIDNTTRTMIYTATQRSQKYALKYFERLRKNTSLIVFETNIWEVTLDNENRTGIDWSALANYSNFGLNIAMPGGAPAGAAAPITITPSYTGSNKLDPRVVFDFISEHGTVKTVSQPQLTVLSGSSATLEVEQSENYVAGIQRTPSTTPNVPDTVSTTTETIQTGLSIAVNGAWDKSTIYSTIGITLNELLALDEFNPDATTTIQLPRTNSRSLATQVRVRPGDAILIGGLVTQKDDYSASGPGFMKPLFPTARRASTTNTELVFLLRPRIVTFESGDDADTPPVVDAQKQQAPANAVDAAIPATPPAPVSPPPAPVAAPATAVVPKEDAPVIEPPPEEAPLISVPPAAMAPAPTPAKTFAPLPMGKPAAVSVPPVVSEPVPAPMPGAPADFMSTLPSGLAPGMLAPKSPEQAPATEKDPADAEAVEGDTPATPRLPLGRINEEGKSP
jgi:type II secretory pathway component GspD/PulD (secretin)